MKWQKFPNVPSVILPLLWHQLPNYSRKLKYMSGLMSVKPLGKTSRIDTYKLLYLLIINRTRISCSY
jgi:hypothetical protein